MEKAPGVSYIKLLCIIFVICLKLMRAFAEVNKMYLDKAFIVEMISDMMPQFLQSTLICL